MPTTDRELPQVVVNKLTQAQYNAATKSADEFYLVTDAKVTGDDIDWSTMKLAAPTATALQDYGTISSNQEITVPYTGFMTGKGVTLGNGFHGMFCLAANDSGPFLGGIPYSDYSGNNQVAFCFPVIAGQKIYARCSGSSKGIMEQVKLVAPQFG